MVDRQDAVRRQLAGVAGRPHGEGQHLASPRGGELAGLAEELEGGVAEAVAHRLRQHQDVVGHASSPRARSRSRMAWAAAGASPASISARLAAGGG